MYFTKSVIERIVDEAKELISLYCNKYSDFKKSAEIDGECDVIWCDGYTEPFCADYIADVEKMPERKILRSEPKKKAFCSKHYLNGGEPVYSVGFDERGEALSEKFYVRRGGDLIGAAYMLPSKAIVEVTVTKYIEGGRPAEYTRVWHIESANAEIECCVYTYDGEHIISADYITDLHTSKAVMMYDDPVYENWESRDFDYMMKAPRMNPLDVRTYVFIYGDSGSPTEFSRTSYSHNIVSTRQWKARKALFKRFRDYGILWFTKQ